MAPAQRAHHGQHGRAPCRGSRSARGLLCVVLLRDVDGARLQHADSFRSRHVTEVFLEVFEREREPGVIVIATAKDQAALHSALNATHFFKKVVSLKPPDRDARKQVIVLLRLYIGAFSDCDAQILEQIMKSTLDNGVNLSIDGHNPVNVLALAAETEGYLATDLRDFVSRAVHRAAVRSTTGPDASDFVRFHLGLQVLCCADERSRRR